MASTIIRRDVLAGAAAFAAALALPAKVGSARATKTHEVQIKSFKFEPHHLVVKVGDTIRWTNVDLAPHTATATHAGWDTGEIAKGESRTLVVTKGMETGYFCAFHPHMKGTIELIQAVNP